MADSFTAPLLGLVLSGGSSSRMGVDKSQITYHGVPQSEWMLRMTRPFCEDVFISSGMDINLSENITVLKDDPKWGAIGPAAGLLTAAALRPDAAWLVTGCDYPYFPTEGIFELVRNRSKEHAAVAFMNAETGSPEPLLTIYEPSAIRRLQDRLENGDSSLRRLLEEIQTVRLLPIAGEWICSVDTPAERDKALATFNTAGITGPNCR
ncbi:MAG: hypothetical protein RL021_523 [Bacteroidota bacterium]|jgi:molybdopterin-guanine dinucleotide biosynthesis protein A